MSKFFRNLLFSLIASVGLFIIIVVVLEALGVDTNIDIDALMNTTLF